jgi:hypothetical protein
MAGAEAAGNFYNRGILCGRKQSILESGSFV